MPFDSVDRRAVSLTDSDTNRLANQPDGRVSDLGTQPPASDRIASAGDLSVLAQAWPHLPGHLRAAILLMVQPWADEINGAANKSPAENGDVE